MENSISQRIQRWASEENGDTDFNSIHAEISYLAAKRFDRYVPTFGTFQNFESRLEKWLENQIPEDDRKILFRMVLYLFFLGHEELVALQRAALRGPVIRWLINTLGLSIDAVDLDAKLDAAIQRTWFCPITDSANIQDFYHVNRITNVEDRIQWRAFARITGGDSTKLKEYMAQKGLATVALIEDIVGSGSQMSDLEPLFKTLPESTPVLLCPLIVCPNGAQVGRSLASNYPNVSFDPVMELLPQSFVTALPDPDEPAFYATVRDLIQRIYLVVSSGEPASNIVKPYGPFGWQNTGALIVTYSNTPDNTLPVIQHASKTWNPLFPRSSRID
ncbi:MAG TPA: hypothetical protein VMH00_16595 [Candidatus Limnocylindrales bacterium]|nr:hypothetical protein [Candidatus Limnocylindrales bacterium]